MKRPNRTGPDRTRGRELTKNSFELRAKINISKCIRECHCRRLCSPKRADLICFASWAIICGLCLLLLLFNEQPGSKQQSCPLICKIFFFCLSFAHYIYSNCECNKERRIGPLDVRMLQGGTPRAAFVSQNYQQQQQQQQWT